MHAERRASLATAWQAMAMRKGPMAWALWPLSWLYGMAVSVKRTTHRWGWLPTEQLDVPVIVVGNVVVGGAGKTPTVIALVHALREAGWTPGVISRGHGRAPSPAPLPVLADSHARDVGDEPLQIQRATSAPVFVAQRRIDAGRALRQAHPEVNVVLTDDGLQHWALHRDVSVVVMDDRGVGNGWLLPAGLLREPWPPVPPNWPSLVLLQRPQHQPPADCPIPEGLPRFEATRSLSRWAINGLGQQQAWADWGNTPIRAVAGVARPEVFFDMLRQGGLTALTGHARPDHAGVDDYAAVWTKSDSPLLCTDKDAVKLFAVSGINLERIWRVPLVLNHSHDWTDAVIARLSPRL
jgi:tetraacyldisaccharide 4'-kinase